MKNYLFLIIFKLLVLAGVFSQESYSRIISLSPALTESIYLLDSGSKLIGNTTYCIKPEQAKQIEKVGDLVDIDIEKIIMLQPDLILTTTMTRFEKIQKLIKTGYKVEVFYEPSNFNDVCSQFVKLGIILNKQKKAADIINDSIIYVNNITDQITNLPKVKVFMQIGADPLFTVIKNSYINDYIELSGGINIAKNAKNGLFNREEVIKSDPDIIIITEMGLIGKEEINIWKRYKSLNAVKQNRIYLINEYLVCSPNPQTFCSGLKEFIKIIHPEIKIK